MECWIPLCGLNEAKVKVSVDEMFANITIESFIAKLLSLGKVFPKLKRKGSSRFHSDSVKEEVVPDEEEPTTEHNTSDFVFRIVYPNFTRTTFPQSNFRS